MSRYRIRHRSVRSRQEKRVGNVADIVLRTALAGMISASLGGEACSQTSKAALEPPVADLAAALPMLNEGLPKQIDNITRLDRVSGAGTTVYYDYMLTDRSGTPLGREEAKAMATSLGDIEDGIKAQACGGGAGRLVRRGMTVGYRYSGIEGIVKEILLKPGACDQVPAAS
jgi:hypothetical protein